MKLDPPAFQNDFSTQQADAWHVLLSSWMDRERAGVQPPNGQGLFYNLGKDNTPGDPVTDSVPWDAFPRFIQEWFAGEPDADPKRWQAAETLRPLGMVRIVENGQLGDPIEVSHRQQDEYCEWFAEFNESGKIQRVSFTAEGPEYWEFIASGTKPFFNDGDPRQNLVAGNPDQLVQLYRDLLHNESVVKEDLYWQTDVAMFNKQRKRWELLARKGDYNRFNKWNTTQGAVHLTHPANTLGAEVNLAAQATLLRSTDAGPVVSAQPLICCSGFGGVMRSSDPNIGSFVNTFARQGLSVTLANPVGLYIGELLPGITGKDGADVTAVTADGASVWTVVRGKKDQKMILRAVFEIPAALGFTVSDCKSGGQPIQFGGQIADHIKMRLSGAVKKLSKGPFVPRPCVQQCCSPPDSLGKPTIKGIPPVAKDCSSIDWAGMAPTLPVHEIAEALPTEAPVEAVIQPKPAYTASRVD
jgi:hypothetical protein